MHCNNNKNISDSNEPSEVGAIEVTFKDNEVANIEEITVTLNPKDGEPVTKSVLKPNEKTTDLLKLFPDVEKPVKLNSIVIVIKKKYAFVVEEIKAVKV